MDNQLSLFHKSMDSLSDGVCPDYSANLVFSLRVAPLGVNIVGAISPEGFLMDKQLATYLSSYVIVCMCV